MKITKHFISTLTFFGLIILLGYRGLSAREFLVMSYNVENLFDTVKDPRWNDTEFLPDGSAHWTNEKLLGKLKNLAEVVKSSDSDGKSACPDVLALVEVENYAVLKFWNEHYLKECGYSDDNIFIYQPAADEKVVADKRGIKVALISRLQSSSRPYLHFVYEGARYILEVNLEYDGTPITFFVNHWKSRRGGGEEKRIKSAQVLMKRLEEYQKYDPDHDIVIMGDFNDQPENKSLFRYLNTEPDPEEVVRDITDVKLWNTSFNLFYLPKLIEDNRDYLSDEELQELVNRYTKLRGTYHYHKENKFYQLDQMLISRGMLDDEGFRYIPDSFKVVKPKKFQTEEGGPLAFRQVGANQFIGASDHFPIMMRISRN